MINLFNDYKFSFEFDKDKLCNILEILSEQIYYADMG